MDGIGDDYEVSLKIRSAIKAKLVELGAYVDDELPDYIMIMVANQRLKQQMDSDLKLFLGANTLNFTGWLYTVLQKLQEVTVANNESKRSALPAKEVEKPPINVAKPAVEPSEDEKHKPSKHKSKSKKSSSKRKSTESKKHEKMPKDADGKVVNVMTTNVESFSSKAIDKVAKGKLKTGAAGIVEPSKSFSQQSTSPKEEFEKSSISPKSHIAVNRKPLKLQRRDILLPDIEAKKPAMRSDPLSQQKLGDSSPDFRLVDGSGDESSDEIRTVNLIQSDDEDFDDIINIKDAGMKEFLDLELPEDLPKVNRTIGLSSSAVPTQGPITVNEMDHNKLEVKKKAVPMYSLGWIPPRSTPKMYSEEILLSEEEQINRRLALRGRPEPRAKIIIDPDEFNISGPPYESDVPRASTSGGLGGTVEGSKKITSAIVGGPAVETRRSPIGRTVHPPPVGRAVPLTADVKRASVMDRLGKRQNLDPEDERPSARPGPLASSREIDDNASSVPNERKAPREPEKAPRSVLDRLGVKPVVAGRISAQRAEEKSELLRWKREDARKDLETRMNASPPEGSFEARFMDRLGKKETVAKERGATSDRAEVAAPTADRVKVATASTSERVKVIDRLGRKVPEEEAMNKGDVKKRPTRIISIREALEGELKFSAAAKRARDEKEKEKEKEEEEDQVPRKRPLLSRVVAVKRVEGDDDEVPDAGLAVASVVRVKARPRLPAALQANKNLLLKAMAEAHKSVAAAPKRQEVQPEVKNKDGFFTRKYRQTGPEKMNITVSNPLSEQSENKKNAGDFGLYTRKFRETVPDKTEVLANRIHSEQDEQHNDAASGGLYTRKYRETHHEKTDVTFNRINYDSEEQQSTAIRNNKITRKICEGAASTTEMTSITEKTSVSFSNMKCDHGELLKEATSKTDSLFTRIFRGSIPEKMNITLTKKAPAVVDEEDAPEMSTNNITRTFINPQKRPRVVSPTFKSPQKHPRVTSPTFDDPQIYYPRAISPTVDKADSVQAPAAASEAHTAAETPTVEYDDDDDDDDDEVLEEIYEEDDVMIFETSRDSSARSTYSRLGNASPANETDADAAYAPSGARYCEDDEPEPTLHKFDRRRLGARPVDNTKFMVTLDGLDPTVFNARKRPAEHAARAEERPTSPLPVPERERIKNWLVSLNRVKEEEEEAAAAAPVTPKKPRLASTVELVTKPSDRCKYWPSCRQGDRCEFVHPSTACKTFPNCMFGDKCMYVHPSCKFATSCTRLQCPFAHTISRPVQAVVPTRSRATHAQPICKFHPKCSNVNCAFVHPKACRFGRSCTNAECVFYHEELPSTEKLKWVKTKAF